MWALIVIAWGGQVAGLTLTYIGNLSQSTAWYNWAATIVKTGVVCFALYSSVWSTRSICNDSAPLLEWNQLSWPDGKVPLSDICKSSSGTTETSVGNPYARK